MSAHPTIKNNNNCEIESILNGVAKANGLKLKVAYINLGEGGIDHRVWMEHEQTGWPVRTYQKTHQFRLPRKEIVSEFCAWIMSNELKG